MGVDPLEDPTEANEDKAEKDQLIEETFEEQKRRNEESHLATPDPDVPVEEGD